MRCLERKLGNIIQFIIKLFYKWQSYLKLFIWELIRVEHLVMLISIIFTDDSEIVNLSEGRKESYTSRYMK